MTSPPVVPHPSEPRRHSERVLPLLLQQQRLALVFNRRFFNRFSFFWGLLFLFISLCWLSFRAQESKHSTAISFAWLARGRLLFEGGAPGFPVD